MRFEEIVAHGFDFVKRQFGACMRVEHGRLIDERTGLRHSRFDDEIVDVDVRHVEGGALRRQFADGAALHAVAVDEAGDFNAGFRREVGDEAVVEDVAADFNRLVRNHGFHDVGAVFERARMGKLFVVNDFVTLTMPSGDLVLATAEIFVQRDVELFDEFGVEFLDEVGMVFGRVFGGFRVVVAEMLHDFETDHVVVLFSFLLAGGAIELFSGLADFRIDAAAVFRDLQQPRHVVDTGDLPCDGIVFFPKAELTKKMLRADLHGMAEADGLDAAFADQEAREDGHWIRVVEEPCTRADGLHVVRKTFEHGNRAQGAEDAADADRVADCLAETVFFRNFEIRDGGGFVAADLNGVDDKVRVFQSGLPLLDAQMGGDDGTFVIDVLVEIFEHELGLMETLGINVIEGDVAVPQAVREHGVADDVFGEDGAACAHEGDFRHDVTLLCLHLN